MSSLARVRNSGSLFQSNICNIFFLGLKKSCPCYRGVCYCRVSTRRQLTVWLCLYKCSLLTSDRKLKSFIKMKSLTLSLSSGPVRSLLNPLQCSFEIRGNSMSLLSPWHLKKCFRNWFFEMDCPSKLDSHPDNHSQTPRGVIRISSDRDDRMGAKIKLKKP